jgi:pimeloyl-ACP methyl ester carboxylesterase
MAEITHRTIEANGIKLHIAEAGAGPLVIMIHGFPELWYSWRHQLPALAGAGYHAVAPDVRGYGGSDAPQPIEAYNMKSMTADIAGLLDALGEHTAVVAGHDWGAPIAWHCALLYPDRFSAVIAMSVPFLPRGPVPPLQLLRQVFADRFFYIIYFQEPGVAEKELEADVRGSLRRFMYRASGDAPTDVELAGSLGLLEDFGTPAKPGSTFLEGMIDPVELPAWITEADIDYYAKEFERTGFRGGLNRYRNMDRDWEELPQLAGAKVQQPAVFITGERDGVRNFTSTDGMVKDVPNLRDMIVVPEAGHWVQQERPAEVNAAMIEFLKSLS